MDCEYMRVGNDEESFMNGSSSWMDIKPMSHEEIPGISTLDKSNQVFAPSFHPVASLDHDEHLRNSSVISHSPFAKSSYHMMMPNQDMSGNFPPYYSSHCPSDSGFVEPITRNPSLRLEDGSFSKLGSSFEMNQCVDIVRTSSSMEEGLEMDRNRMSEEDFRKFSPNERRKIHQHGFLHAIKDNEGDEKRYHSENTCEQTEEKEKYPQNPHANVFRAQKGTEAKIMYSNEEAPKENYTHVRARRGQATSSHSLAERVRREKISERMRLLQELVPGCNKITGKAVMLDEIINYVQSLQQQVEFLSMKLATVRPHLAIDLERITSMHDVQSGVIPTSVPEMDCGTGSLHPYIQGIFQKSLPVNPNVKELIPYLRMIIRDSKLKMQDAGFVRQLEEIFDGRPSHI